MAFGLEHCASDTGVFRLKSLDEKEFRLPAGVYVDDLIFPGETGCFRELTAILQQPFAAKGLGSLLSYYVGCKYSRIILRVI